MKETMLKKILISVVLIFAALLSMLMLSDKASDPAVHEKTIASIDEKVDTVLKLTATSTLASAGISTMPGDAATPIAEKLADFTEYFLLILCVLYAEKYLLTIVGVGAFKILFPFACLLWIISLFWNPTVMKRLSVKCAVFGLALYFTVPLSIGVSDMIYRSYQDSIDSTIAAAEEFTETTDELAGVEDAGLLTSIMGKLSETASTLSDKAARVLNHFVESLAVLIVTSCVIPVLSLLFFLWLIKLLTGVEISPVPGRPGWGKRRHDAAPEGAEDA